jgi:2-oxoglutarate dehydrogenase E1 component
LCCAAARSFTICGKPRAEQELDNVAIVRIEQLYPFPDEDLLQELSRFDKAEQGDLVSGRAHQSGRLVLDTTPYPTCDQSLDKVPSLHYAGREAFAAPAVGYASVHNEQQQQLVQTALTEEPRDDMENGH